MLLRDAQEEARVVYTARRDLAEGGRDLILSHVSEVIEILQPLKEAEKSTWTHLPASKKRTVGLLLLVAMGLANQTQVDSLEALKSILLEESP